MADYLYTIWQAAPEKGDTVKKFNLHDVYGERTLELRQSDPLHYIGDTLRRYKTANDAHEIIMRDRQNNVIYWETVGWARRNPLTPIPLENREAAYPWLVDQERKAKLNIKG